MLLTPTISESVSLLVSIVTCTPKQALVKDFVKVIVVLEFLPQYVFPHFKINVPICIPPFVPLFEKLVIAKPASLEQNYHAVSFHDDCNRYLETLG